MNFLEDLRYVKSHKQVKTLEDGAVLVGASDYTQDALGDLIFVNLPKTEGEVTGGKPFVDAGSVKTVSDVYSPVGDTVVEVNEALLDTPESVDEAPYKTWFIRAKSIAGTARLMSTTEYEGYVETLD